MLYRQKVTALAQALERTRNPHRGLGGASRPHRRHRPDAEPWRTANRAERESGSDAGGRPKCEEVARNGRPLAASCDGCGGSQPTLSAALATCGLSQRATVFQACSFKVRTWPAAVTSRHARRRLFPPPCLPPQRLGGRYGCKSFTPWIWDGCSGLPTRQRDRCHVTTTADQATSHPRTSETSYPRAQDARLQDKQGAAPPCCRT